MSRSSAQSIDRPIFLLGSGRSGTTVLYHLLAVHPELCWFSNISNRLPWLPLAPLAHRLLDAGQYGEGIRRNIISRKGGKLHIRPVEAEVLYERAGFVSDRRLTESDFDPRTEDRFRRIIDRHLQLTGRPRFISKQTANTQRYRLLNRMFPDALFIHLIRDGRAVANSIRGQKWLDTMTLWWLEDLARNHVHDYADPIELCGMHWQKNLDELLAARDLLGHRYMELRYEDLTSDVHGHICSIVEFCGLSAPQEYFRLLPERMPNMNDKWQQDLSAHQIEVLQRVIGPSLQALGYPV